MIQLCMQTVVAAIFRDGDKILIAERSASGPHPLKWEFPGGKVEAGETERGALRRELREELGIEAEPGLEFARYEYAYPGKPAILLAFFEIESWAGVIVNRGVFEQLTWDTAQNLSRYNFLEGDLLLIELLREVHINQV